MNNVCGNCQYWGTPSESSQDFTYRSCQAIKHDKDGSTSDWRQEQKIYKNQEGFENLYEDYLEGIDNLSGQKAVSCDRSRYFACLKTASDFGCVLFKEK